MGRWSLSVAGIIVLALVQVLLSANNAEGIAVMSVDLGSEWMKIGIVSPGVPMEIVLNKESKRKTRTVVSFRDGERTFGEDAETIGVRFPANSYKYLTDLLGKKADNSLVKLYASRFPEHKLLTDPERGTVIFEHPDGQQFTPEELVAQLLRKAKDFAEVTTGQTVTDCVLTVPAYFNQAERSAVLQSAKLAKLKVLQLVNEHAAVATNYALYQQSTFNETSQLVMFYDMGASKTVASIVSYRVATGPGEQMPHITVLGVGYDRTLGGLEVQLRLRDYLAKAFNHQNKTKSDVFDNRRAMAKLFKEAGRVKTILSANPEHTAQVEGLLEDHDFRQHVTREQLEGLCGDLLERVVGPAKRALKAAGLKEDGSDLVHVVLAGAGTRIPAIQAKLLDGLAAETLAKNLNTDEAATMGAVYIAAGLSTGFRVRKMVTRDAVLLPVQVEFERAPHEQEGTDAAATKPPPPPSTTIKRTLFGAMDTYPQKKVITFSRHTVDFTFNVGYGDLSHLGEEEAERVGNRLLRLVTLKGIGEALDKHRESGAESKGVKAHFQLDESGMLHLPSAELVLERAATAEDEPGDEQSPLSKLGSTISKLFASGEQNENATEEVHNTTKTKTDDSKPAEATKSSDKPKIVTVKETVSVVSEATDVPAMDDAKLAQSEERLSALEKVDRARAKRELALNALESLVVEAQSRLTTDEYSKAASATEMEEIRAACSKLSDWLYDEADEKTSAETFDAKSLELRKLTDPVWGRAYEHRERPEAVTALGKMLEGAQAFLDSAKNLTGSADANRAVFTEVEVTTLAKLIQDTKEWKTKESEAQKKLQKHEPVRLTVRAIGEKMQALDREVKYLVAKLKLWRPPQEKAKKESTGGGKKKAKTQSKSQESSEENEEKIQDTKENLKSGESVEDTQEVPPSVLGGVDAPVDEVTDDMTDDVPNTSPDVDAVADTDNEDQHSEL